MPGGSDEKDKQDELTQALAMSRGTASATMLGASDAMLTDGAQSTLEASEGQLLAPKYLLSEACAGNERCEVCAESDAEEFVPELC